ncbi:MAG TPA: sigma-70 family RNA polymerase sigma factor [Stenotrophomonas sp.]|nr:sigma-70 family RNA polymerase sigma factor [Stenotrophomonas sp.]
MPSDATAPLAADRAAAFTALLERHRGIVVKVAASYAGSAEERAELIQEIAAQLWRAYPRYDPARSFTTWMYRVALNVAISDLRGRSHERAHLAPLDDALHVADPQARDPATELQIAALHRFIAALPPLERALLLLYLDERSYAEIAEVLGISEGNAATKVSRLKQRIQREL